MAMRGQRDGGAGAAAATTTPSGGDAAEPADYHRAAPAATDLRDFMGAT